MTAAGDQLARDHSREVERSVRDLRRRVESAVRRSNRAWSTPEGQRRLAALIDPALALFGARSLADYYAYVTRYAQLEEGPPPQLPLTLQRSPEASDAGLKLAAVMAGVAARARARGESESYVESLVAVVTGGAASRVAQLDKRRWEFRYLTTDPGVLGYRRVPDSKPCAFCAMLASRGFVYREARFTHVNRAAGDTRVLQGWHDACGCTSQATFARGARAPSLDPVTLRARKIYADSTGKYTGVDKARAFRRAWEEAGRK